MAEHCQICRTIEGKRPGRGEMCEDCKSNPRAQAAYEWIGIMELQHVSAKLYAYGFPVLMIFGDVVRVLKHMGWGWIGMDIVAWGVWVFNVFYFWPKKGMPIRGYNDRMEKARADLFVAKLAGERRFGE